MTHWVDRGAKLHGLDGPPPTRTGGLDVIARTLVLSAILFGAGFGGGWFVSERTTEPAEGPPATQATEPAEASHDGGPLMEWGVTGRFAGIDAGPVIVLASEWCSGEPPGCSFSVENGSMLDARISFKSVGAGIELPVEFYLLNGDGDRVLGKESDSNPGVVFITVEGDVGGEWALRAQAFGDVGYRDVAFHVNFMVT